MQMIYNSKLLFFRKGTKPTVTHEDECPICQEHVPTNAGNYQFSVHILHFHKAAKDYFLGVKQPIQPCEASSRRNYMMQIKSCGHCFCWDCLETWLEERDSCPMCRACLFCVAKGVGRRSYASEREYLEIRDMGAQAVRDMVTEEYVLS